MHIECTRQLDASDPDASGNYEYYYEYDMYRFTDGAICFVARSYTDEPDEAHFLRIELDGTPRPMTDSDLARPLFLAAQAHLHGAGKVHLRWLSGRGNGYEPVPSGLHHEA
ncbi:hypothetical protein [Montanilutibacter psychrotolerans]|uniref:Uncharacterized protein n=1 Tax=Montanilutibacter psychrotolerans TaxID=1327343 RepID=A0A3M8SZV7_9GAMM|nr:hypothetical protein [Lysobacter psychrotolerans]RNF86235.1 hypothetical protein EER27_02090 [Lysobacter psychrotolerans]